MTELHILKVEHASNVGHVSTEMPILWNAQHNIDSNKLVIPEVRLYETEDGFRIWALTMGSRLLFATSILEQTTIICSVKTFLEKSKC